MPRTRTPARIALALGAALIALLVVLAVTLRSGSGDEPPAAQADPISATGTLSPRIVLFGDTLNAVVDVVVDRTVVDPDDVTVSWSPEPWTPATRPRLERRDSGSTTLLRTTYALRCLTVPCVPVRETEELELEPATVRYAATVGGGTRGLSFDVPWPALTVHTRIRGSGSTQAGSIQEDLLAAPWRADTVSLPGVSFRASPALVVALLVAAGLLFLLAAAVVAYRALPEREPPPEPEPEPEPVVPALEQALALLESPASTNGAHDRRRALELVAEELERWGDDDLAQAVRTLAWSESSPQSDETRAVAARLRERMERMNGVPA
jgi:hypothetical protein